MTIRLSSPHLHDHDCTMHKHSQALSHTHACMAAGWTCKAAGRTVLHCAACGLLPLGGFLISFATNAWLQAGSARAAGRAVLHRAACGLLPLGGFSHLLRYQRMAAGWTCARCRPCCSPPRCMWPSATWWLFSSPSLATHGCRLDLRALQAVLSSIALHVAFCHLVAFSSPSLPTHGCRLDLRALQAALSSTALHVAFCHLVAFLISFATNAWPPQGLDTATLQLAFSRGSCARPLPQELLFLPQDQHQHQHQHSGLCHEHRPQPEQQQQQPDQQQQQQQQQPDQQQHLHHPHNNHQQQPAVAPGMCLPAPHLPAAPAPGCMAGTARAAWSPAAQSTAPATARLAEAPAPACAVEARACAVEAQVPTSIVPAASVGGCAGSVPARRRCPGNAPGGAATADAAVEQVPPAADVVTLLNEVCVGEGLIR